METCSYCHNAPEICDCIDKPGDAPDYPLFPEPVRDDDRGQTYWKYRAGGYNPADGTYGRSGNKEEALRIIRAAARRKALPAIKPSTATA